MIGRLVAAQVWRSRWQLMLLIVWGANSALQTTDVGIRLMMAVPLVSAFTATFSIGLFWTRDVRVLPIPRRIALRSAWLAALAFPVALMSGRVLAAIIQSAFGMTVTQGFETIALTAVWDTTFIGASLTFLQSDTQWSGLRKAFGTLRSSGGMLVTALLLLLPFAGPELVPKSLPDVTWMHVAGILAGVVITVWPLVTAPDQWPRLGFLHDAVRQPARTPTRIQAQPRALDQLVGIRRLLPGPVGTAALVAGLTLAAATALTHSLEGARSLFSPDMTGMEFFLIGGPFFLLMLGPFGWATGLTPFLRGLRTLPISAMRIVLTMTTLPLMMPVFFWVFASGFHLVFGAPGDANWRLGSFSLLCGVMALSGAVHARFNSVLVMMIGWGAGVGGVLVLMGFFDKAAVEPVIAFWFPLVGLIGVPASFLLNYQTITRGGSSSSVYRPAPGASLYRGGR